MGDRGYRRAAVGPRRRSAGTAGAVVVLVAAALTGPAAPGARPPARATGPGSLPAGRAVQVDRAVQVSSAVPARDTPAGIASLAAVRAALRSRAEVLTEDYDRAVVLGQQAAAAYRLAAARLAAARRTEQQADRRLAQLAAADYEADGGPAVATVTLSGLSGPQQYLQVMGAQQVIAGQRAELLAASQADRVVTRLFAAQAAALLARLQAESQSADDLRLAVTAAVRQQTAAVRQAMAAWGKIRARLARAGTGAAVLPPSALAGGPPGAAPGVVSPAWSLAAGASADQGQAAVGWALTQLGRPYQWGGAGPGGYDCSGLVAAAWARAGVRLDHWTGFQWVSGPHVPVSQLRPGDLVFYAADVADPATIHHVGLYLGDGKMVDAPYTGADVRIDSIYAYPGLIGTTRPAAAD